MPKRIGTWSIRLMAPDEEHDDEVLEEQYDLLNSYLNDTEEDLNDQLDDGYYVKIEQ